MIKVLIKKENNKINEIEFLGHALYDDSGKDIVCASVSSIVITTVNGILSIDDKALSYEERPLIIKVNSYSKETVCLINNMISLLYELEKDYPKNITLKEE